jgi:hypothetical protein
VSEKTYTSVVDQRKSDCASCLMYGIRTIVAVEPLVKGQLCTWDVCCRFMCLHCS